MTDRAESPPPPAVCVVDDDRSVRVALERLLIGGGWSVRTFASAEEFLEADAPMKCACVVADVHLGKMSGLELQEILATQPRRPAMILTSGLAEEEMAADARRLGAIAFFRKPFDADRLIDAVTQGIAMNKDQSLSDEAHPVSTSRASEWALVANAPAQAENSAR